jgi:hypothetical protein
MRCLTNQPLQPGSGENRNYTAHSLKMFVYLYTTNAVMPHPQPGA